MSTKDSYTNKKTEKLLINKGQLEYQDHATVNNLAVINDSNDFFNSTSQLALCRMH